MASPVEEFESSLKVVVTAKRLSQSKMAALTELALKNMKLDAQLVSALYRTHKYLPASNKISSLYVFDALARAAKHQAVKHGMPVNVNKGNSATFMLKLEGILEDLFVDLCGATTEVPELKDKMKKVLDLWSKNSTFPPLMLAKLKGLVNGVDSPAQVPTFAIDLQTAASVDPRRAASTGSPYGQPGAIAGASSPPSSGTPPTNGTPTSALPPALLALLATAAPSASAAPTPPLNTTLPNVATPTEAPTATGTPTSQYSAAQIALLQQLAIAGGLVHPTVGTPRNPVSGTPNPEPTQPIDRRGPPPPRNGPPGRSPREQDDYDYDDYRPPHRGGWRGRGRGDFEHRGGRDSWRGQGRPPYRGSDPRRGGGRGGGGGWSSVRDDNDYDYRHRSRSRSRSPPPLPRRGGGDSSYYGSEGRRFDSGYSQRRNDAPYSPKRSPQRDSSTDEFGRETRPAPVSDMTEQSPPTKQKPLLPTAQQTSPITSFVAQPQLPSTTSQLSPDGPLAQQQQQQQQRSRPSRFSQQTVQAIPTFESSTVNENPNSTNTKAPSPTLLPIAPGENVPYLYQFDFTAHDFSQPPAWEALAKSFQITNGYMPSQEELMAMVMMAMQTLQAQAISQQWNMEAPEGDAGAEENAQNDWNGAAAVGTQNQSGQGESGGKDVSDPEDASSGKPATTTRDPRLAAARDEPREVDSPGDMSLSPPDSPKSQRDDT